MKDRSFVIAVALVGALALLIIAGNIRDASAPLYGPPNVDEKQVMSKVQEGQLSFEEARFYYSGGALSASRRADTTSAAPSGGTLPSHPGRESESGGAGGRPGTGGLDAGKRCP